MFFRYLHEAGGVGQNPARLVRRAMCAPPPPRAFTDDERDRLLATLGRRADSRPSGTTLLFHLLLATGIRLGSCIALDVDDVDLDGRRAPAEEHEGRSARARVPRARRSPTTCAAGSGTASAGPLFTGRRGRRLTPRHVQRRFKEWLKRAGIARPRRRTLPATRSRRISSRGREPRARPGRAPAPVDHSTMVYAKVNEASVRAALG